MLWVDKYRPKELDALDVHTVLTSRLKRLVSNGDCPHLLVFGPSGAGKKTRVMALLRHYFGPGVERLKAEHKTYKATESKSVEVSTLSSQHHIEINPSEVGIYDRVVVMTPIKEIAESAPLDTTSKGTKVIILNEVDQLTRSAQQALRRTMEKHMKTCRLILLATTTSKVIAPLRSRCLGVRVPAPTCAEIATVLASVAKKEGLTLPEQLADRIAHSSDRNLRRAILMLESTKVQSYPFTADQSIVRTDWENYIALIAREMCAEQSPKQILEVRGKLYELLANCIPPDIIFQRLSRELSTLAEGLTAEVAHWAAHYEHRSQLGSKPIFHLEAFVCKFMHLYKCARA
eukprot:NODE_2614_length_1136_cov_67.844400_g2494_i0.p1 GENE.NODE_2614_length_1136_cov_67.844400_g2494_i0~~NODE_2614_length_1136_cov_67.844400_g2494_i0.p1  ORF type:complete len:346 (+),score=92.55 NODE_2614_length_1136_cov_67.844400_g2494_i0:65-1102(+)